MNIELKEDLKNNKLFVCVCLDERKRLNQPRQRLHWTEMVEYVKENYTPPKNYTLGECKDLYKVADNNSVSQCNVQWEYDLVSAPSKKKIVKSAKATKSTKSTTSKKSE